LKDSLEGKRDQHAKNLYKWQLEASTDGENFVTLLEAPTPTYLGNEVQQFEVDTVRKYNCCVLVIWLLRTLKPWAVLHAIIYLFRLVEYYYCNTQLTPRTLFLQIRCDFQEIAVTQFSIDSSLSFFINMIIN